MKKVLDRYKNSVIVTMFGNDTDSRFAVNLVGGALKTAEF